MRTAAALAAALALLFPAVALAQDVEPKTNLADIEDEVICLVCGTTLEQTENAPQAERLRAQIRELVGQGLTKEEIKDELVAEYGDKVLSTPSTSGFDLTAWVLPGLGIAMAAVALAVGLARTRRTSAPADTPISEDDDARLEADRRRYDL